MTAPRSRMMAILTVVAMLAVGVCIGVALDRNLLHRRGDGRDRGRGRGPFGMMNEPADSASRTRMRDRIVKRITDELTLTTAQAHAVDSIFARQEVQLDSMRARVGPQLDSLRDRMRQSIDSVLTPEQRIKFAESRRRFDARRRANDGDGPPPPRQ
ncbi:MAG: hypothetical protein H7099_16885 [Gemmatimonadaceae bacterium]|nr:hypothetical protein [Gemmatimonadaceae bacterium]